VACRATDPHTPEYQMSLHKGQSRLYEHEVRSYPTIQAYQSSVRDWSLVIPVHAHHVPHLMAAGLMHSEDTNIYSLEARRLGLSVEAYGNIRIPPRSR